MYFIVFDLEFNQDFSSLQNFDKKASRFPFEIIQIGAVKLDFELNTVATFNRLVKPTIYKKISAFITDLTGITTEQLQTEEAFPEVYQSYTDFIGGIDSVFCTWGMSDIKELFKNAQDHQLNTKLLPKMYINLQPCVSKYFGLPGKNALGLQHAVELLNVPLAHKFHDALHDAYYTAEVFKKIYHASSMQPKLYDPNQIIVKPRQQRSIIDFYKLIRQFEKMYDRKMTKEEQEIIKLAYKMGRTRQFVK